jgi:carbon storage regulator
MLVLSRKVGEKIVVPEYCLTVTILRVCGNRVRIGVSAPASLAVHREEVCQRSYCVEEVASRGMGSPRRVKRQGTKRRNSADPEPGL